MNETRNMTSHFHADAMGHGYREEQRQQQTYVIQFRVQSLSSDAEEALYRHQEEIDDISSSQDESLVEFYSEALSDVSTEAVLSGNIGRKHAKAGSNVVHFEDKEKQGSTLSNAQDKSTGVVTRALIADFSSNPKLRSQRDETHDTVENCSLALVHTTTEDETLEVSEDLRYDYLDRDKIWTPSRSAVTSLDRNGELTQESSESSNITCPVRSEAVGSGSSQIRKPLESECFMSLQTVGLADLSSENHGSRVRDTDTDRNRPRGMIASSQRGLDFAFPTKGFWASPLRFCSPEVKEDYRDYAKQTHSEERSIRIIGYHRYPEVAQDDKATGTSDSVFAVEPRAFRTSGSDLFPLPSLVPIERLAKFVRWTSQNSNDDEAEYHESISKSEGEEKTLKDWIDTVYYEAPAAFKKASSSLNFLFSQPSSMLGGDSGSSTQTLSKQEQNTDFVSSACRAGGEDEYHMEGNTEGVPHCFSDGSNSHDSGELYQAGYLDIETENLISGHRAKHDSDVILETKEKSNQDQSEQASNTNVQHAESVFVKPSGTQDRESWRKSLLHNRDPAVGNGTEPEKDEISHDPTHAAQWTKPADSHDGQVCKKKKRPLPLRNSFPSSKQRQLSRKHAESCLPFKEISPKEPLMVCQESATPISQQRSKWFSIRQLRRSLQRKKQKEERDAVRDITEAQGVQLPDLAFAVPKATKKTVRFKHSLTEVHTIEIETTEDNDEEEDEDDASFRPFNRFLDLLTSREASWSIDEDNDDSYASSEDEERRLPLVCHGLFPAASGDGALGDEASLQDTDSQESAEVK